MAFAPLVVVTVGGSRFEFFAEKVFELYLKHTRGCSSGAGRDGCGASRGPCADLELAFAMLGRMLGRPVTHSGVASAFLKALGLPELAKRLGHLSSRRRLVAHPDAALVQHLEDAIRGLDQDCVRDQVLAFSRKLPLAKPSNAQGSAGGHCTTTDRESCDDHG